MTILAPPGASPAPRVWFVDIVRLLASLQMVNGHTIDAVLLPALKSGPIFDRYDWGRGLVSVGFLMVSGIAFSLSSLARAERRGAGSAAAWTRLRRPLVVIAAGYFLGLPLGATSPDPAVVSLAWAYFFSVGILHCIGATLLALELLVLVTRTRAQVVWAAGLLAVLAFALAPLGDATLTAGRPHALWNWVSHQGGALFPLVPWTGHVFAGVVIGAVALPLAGRTPRHVVWARLGLMAAAAWLVSTALQHVPWTWVTAATHPSARPAFVASNLAAVLGATFVASVLCAPLRTLPRPLRILAAETLAIYVFHLVVLFGFELRLARRIGPTLDLPRAMAFAGFMIALTGAFALAWHTVKARWRRPLRRRLATALGVTPPMR